VTIAWGTTSQSVATGGVKMLVHGESGAGKTLLAATLPRPLIVSAESGLLSLSRKNIERVYGVNTPGVTYDIPVAHITSKAQFIEVYHYLFNPVNRAREMFSSVAVDSASEIAELLLYSAKSLNKDGRAAYGVMTDEMVQLMKLFRDLAGYNVYMSAKSEMAKDSDGLFRLSPMMPGQKVGPSLPYLFDEVFYLGVARTPEGKKYRYLLTDKDERHAAKDRSGMLDEYEQPFLYNIINKISGAQQ
jgi:hypothetical protein